MNIKFSVAAVALALSAPAFAQEEALVVPVSYADLDLGNEKGVAQLQRRIKQAATKVCGSAIDRKPADRQRALDCQEKSLVQANNDLQTALANTGRGNIRVAQNLQVRAR